MTTSPRLRGYLWRFRFVLAAACVTCAGLLLLADLRPGPRTVEITVTSRDIPAGTVLTGADLRQEQALTAPGDAWETEELIGARLAAGLPEGMPIPGTVLVGPGLTEAAPPGTVVLPVRLADPAMMALVRVGDRMDLYQAPTDSASLAGAAGPAELVAESALVLSRMDSDAGAAGLLGVDTSEQPGVVVVAVADDDATVLSGAGSLAPVRAVLVPGDTS
ncbi:SAF domain-containing protein [Ruania halotolerans]|uniref:SAF domain-containing protein n=1 Tax=Ruania halotolerans TaxID=2897773 RepID=UPI001E31CC2A|nr:SAF domain-containing protein [Ruania halotolerans]UFU07303.1 SAF domain-containing protein [Ruania halotolerans]